MDEIAWLTERFEEDRTRLRAVAYRMLGSLSEAEDAVQEAWLRLSRSDTSEVENLKGWLTTVVGRGWLGAAHMPDRLARQKDGHDPEHEALLAGSVGLALLVVLETLAPAERLPVVLAAMFALPFWGTAPTRQ